MAIASVSTIGRIGIRCFELAIEVDVAPGLPSFSIVGLPDAVVQEAKERIRSAIKNSDATFPLSRITVNLAPSDIKKEGVGFDLPIALGILIASEQVLSPPPTARFYGELGLQGELKPTRGVLSFVIAASGRGGSLFVPSTNAREAALVPTDCPMFGVESLNQLILALKKEAKLNKIKPAQTIESTEIFAYDFADIVGQASAKRAMEIAAAGHHNILLRGSPGSGKTLLSRSLPSIMPTMSRDEVLESTQIWSVAGMLSPDQPLVATRPFRSPHHSASLVALVGGGNPPRPGEISLAHNGVLFLDEFAEFPRGVIEALRQPLEDRIITVARAGVSVVFPAHCLLVAAINPCPCGWRDDPKRQCVCAPSQIIGYKKKLSGPILDRIDLHLIVPPVPVEAMTPNHQAESSEAIRARVLAARAVQTKRYAQSAYRTNSELSSKDIEAMCRIEPQARELLVKAVEKLNLSARAYHKMLKVARTIADLAGKDGVSVAAASEAVSYRPTTDE